MSAGEVSLHDVLIPDLGDVKDIRVIEILVALGSAVLDNESLLTLESEKATMDVPAPFAGTVREIAVAVGEAVQTGRLVMRLEVSQSASVPATPVVTPAVSVPTVSAPTATAAAVAPSVPLTPSRAGVDEPLADITLPLVVLGAGPGGYTAAFRAADLGLEVG